MIEGLQQTNISLNKGIVRTPSLGGEGELSECVNLIPHAGEIVRIKEPQPMGLELLEGEILLATNRCAGEENFIVRNGTALKYYRKAEGIWLGQEIATLTEEEAEVVTIGQTLVVSQGASRRYFLWKEDGYKEQNIADIVPRVELQLGNKGLVPRYVNPQGATEVIGFYTHHWQAGPSSFLLDPVEGNRSLHWYAEKAGGGVNDEELNMSFWAKYNEIRELLKASGAHCFPFYIRWGLELYDGSIVNLSAPILMMPSSTIRPWVGWYYKDHSTILPGSGLQNGENQRWVIGFTPRNLYILVDASELSDIDEALIKGVSVYATPEIEAVDTEAPLFKGELDYVFNCYDKPIEDGLGWDTSFEVSNRTGIPDVEQGVTPRYINYLSYLPVKKDRRGIVEAYNDPTEFYELAHIPWSVLREKGYKVMASYSEGKLPPDGDDGETADRFDDAYLANRLKGYAPYTLNLRLDALTSQKPLAEVMITQQNYKVAKANATYSYNSRIIYGGVDLKVSTEIHPCQILTDNKLPSIEVEEKDVSLAVKIGDAYLSIKDSELLSKYRGESPVVAFPYQDAQGLAIFSEDGEWGTKVFFQRGNASLGGYALWSGITEELIKSSPDIKSAFLSPNEVGEEWKSNSYLDVRASDLRRNTVAVTKVANPWAIEAVYELACGEIYALTSATEALSEGQFGDFPIYAFTDNGIYALSIAQDGTVEAKQPISRDVLLGMNSALQIDKAVIYPTKGGLKLLSGRSTSLLSGGIRGLNVDEVSFSVPEELNIPDTLPFEEQIQNARMVYDYAHQMVHIFPAPPGSGEDDGGGTTTPPEGGDDGGDDGGGDTPTPPEGGDDGGNTGNGGNTTPSEDNEDIEGEVEILSKPRLSVDVDVEWTDDSTIKVLGTVPAGTEKTDPTVMRLTRIMAVKEGEVAVWYQDAPDKTLMEIYVATCTEADLREGRILALLHKKLPVKSDGLRFTYKPSVDCIVFWFADMDNWKLKRPAIANVITPELWPYEIEIKSYDINNYQVVAVVPRGSDQVDADAYRYPYVIPEVQEGDIITWTFDEPRTSNANAYILYGTIDDVTVGFLSPLRYCIGQAADDTNTVYQATADKTGPLIWRFEHATVTITRKAPVSASTFSLRGTISTEAEAEAEGPQKHYVYDLTSGQWATQILNEKLTTVVPGYPFSTMQFGTQLMQYTNELEADVVKQGWLLTRPISFSDPFTRKMLADIRLLGQKTHQDTKLKVQVYISEDRVKWHRLTSLKGRSAKWYRFLIKADMCGLDTLTGITCQYVPRLGNKLR